MPERKGEFYSTVRERQNQNRGVLRTFRELHGPEVVDVHDAPVHVNVGVPDSPADGDAAVVDENVDATVDFHGAGGRGGDGRGGGGQVEGQHCRGVGLVLLRAARADLSEGLLVPRRQDEPAPAGGELHGQRAADAGAGAGDEHHLPLQGRLPAAAQALPQEPADPPRQEQPEADDPAQHPGKHRGRDREMRRTFFNKVDFRPGRVLLPFSLSAEQTRKEREAREDERGERYHSYVT